MFRVFGITLLALTGLMFPPLLFFCLIWAGLWFASWRGNVKAERNAQLALEESARLEAGRIIREREVRAWTR